MVLDPNLQAPPIERINLHSVVDVRYKKHRLDRVAAALFSHFSRSRIQKWIKNGEITCELEKLFNWINLEYKLKRTDLNDKERQLAEEVKKRFPVDQWRVIKIFSDHQKKYRYYKKAIEDVKRRTTPRMNEQAIMTIFSPGWGINT